MKTKISNFTLVLISLSFFSFVNISKDNSYLKIIQESNSLQESPTLPVGTIIQIRTTKDIFAKNFNYGDHFFVDLAEDITSKGKVLIPAGTMVQIDVLQSDNRRRRSSVFTVTVGGFIIDNYLQKVKTEVKQVTTEDQAGQTIKKAAIGAGIGAVYDGGRGAGRGAAIGTAVGLLKPGQSIYFPKGTEATFQLVSPLKVTWL